MTPIHGQTEEDLKKYLIEMGEKLFRVKQIFEWIYVREGLDLGGNDRLGQRATVNRSKNQKERPFLFNANSALEKAMVVERMLVLTFLVLLEGFLVQVDTVF